MTYKIKEMSWTEMDERFKHCQTIIIPLGANEVYGPHLPLGTDIIVASSIAELVAEKTGAFIGPEIGVGESSNLVFYPNTLTIKKENFQNYLDDIYQGLIKYGFKNFLFINGHLGNVDAVNYLSRRYIRQYGIKAGQIDWWRFAGTHGKGIMEEQGYMANGHASETGTSVMLYLHPEMVHMEKTLRVESNPDLFTKFNDVIRYVSFEEKTVQATVGDSTKATAEKGRKLVEVCVNRIVEYMHYEFGDILK